MAKTWKRYTKTRPPLTGDRVRMSMRHGKHWRWFYGFVVGVQTPVAAAAGDSDSHEDPSPILEVSWGVGFERPVATRLPARAFYVHR